MDKIDFGARSIQKYRTSFIVTIPKTLVLALGLHGGVLVNFILNDDRTITLRPEVGEEVKNTLVEVDKR